MNNQSINILLAEDHAVLREALQFLLEAEPGLRVVGQATDGHEAVEMAARLKPDIAIMDIGLPSLNGLEATRHILQAVPSCRVLVLSAHSDDAYLEQSLAMGASGYLVKQSSTGLLVKAIREIAGGSTFFKTSPGLNGDAIVSGQKKNNGAPGLLGVLTAREREVLQLVAEGKANKQTADILRISIKTVEKHRQHLMEKLGIHDTAGLTRYAISSGIIENHQRPPTV